ncbi:MAG: hypothetical protein LBC07_04290 [Elusimicrobiota bacterium]|nr:hypothetical protein [Elusimicrobiota bacterium]
MGRKKLKANQKKILKGICISQEALTFFKEKADEECIMVNTFMTQVLTEYFEKNSKNKI